MAGNHDDLAVVLKLVLVESVGFAEEAPGAVALDSVTDFAAGHNSGRARLVRYRQDIGNHQAAVITATVVVNVPELTGTLQTLAFRE